MYWVSLRHHPGRKKEFLLPISKYCPGITTFSVKIQELYPWTASNIILAARFWFLLTKRMTGEGHLSDIMVACVVVLTAPHVVGKIKNRISGHKISLFEK